MHFIDIKYISAIIYIKYNLIKGDIMNYFETLKKLYYNNSNIENIKQQIQKTLNFTNEINNETLYIFHKILTSKPCYYYDKDVYKQTKNNLEKLYLNNPTTIKFNNDILEHYLIAYHTYSQITDIINDLSELNNNTIIKNRMYRLPTYISIVEGCLTNLFKVITLLINFTTSKDFASQKKLRPLCEILRNNEFELLQNNIQIDIRNAINHGGVIFADNGGTITFRYNSKGKSEQIDLSTYEFDELINNVYDSSSAIILGITHFLNDHIELISIDKHCNSYIAFEMFALELSIPGVYCEFINEAKLSNKQLNIQVFTDNTDEDFLLQTVIELAALSYNNFPNYDKYDIFFRSERLQTNFVEFSKTQVLNMINGSISPQDTIRESINNNEVMFIPPSTEDIDLQEIKYYIYPNFSSDKFKITNIRNASTQEYRRLRANLFIGDIIDKQEILEIIYQSIYWLKNVKSMPSPTIPQKHGTMDADALYISIFKSDSRHNKQLFPSNDNFVCFVDYSKDGKTHLPHGGIPESLWKSFHHEQIGNIAFAWRENKYIIRANKNKIGRNDPCPCGSGLKYKKCCGKK